LAAVKIFPPPSVTSLADPSAVPLPLPLPDAALDDPVAAGALDVVAGAGALDEVLLATGLELAAEEQPASSATPATPATPAPASAALRVASPSRMG
jgi:hypothetical protein